MLPNVAIICTNYNYGRFVIDALVSIEKQTYDGPLRVYIVDDGSTDNSWECIQQYLKNHHNVPVTAIQIPNSGASVARNTALEACWDWADIIGILDADDEYKPEKVDILVTKLMEHSEIGVAYADYDIRKNFAGKSYTKEELKISYSRDELVKRCIVHSGALIKKIYLEKVILPNGEIFDSRLHGPASKEFIGCTEDYDLWLRLSGHCIICHVPESLSIVNETGQNQSMKMTTKIFNKNAEILGTRI